MPLDHQAKNSIKFDNLVHHLSLFLLAELKSIVPYVQSLECPLLILFLRQDNFKRLGVFGALS